MGKRNWVKTITVSFWHQAADINWVGGIEIFSFQLQTRALLLSLWRWFNTYIWEKYIPSILKSFLFLFLKHVCLVMKCWSRLIAQIANTCFWTQAAVFTNQSVMLNYDDDAVSELVSKAKKIPSRSPVKPPATNAPRTSSFLMQIKFAIWTNPVSNLDKSSLQFGQKQIAIWTCPVSNWDKSTMQFR